MILVKFRYGLNTQGFTVIEEKQWINFTSQIGSLFDKDGMCIIPHYGGLAFRFSNYDSLLNSFDVAHISEEAASSLKNLFNLPYGIFPKIKFLNED